MRVEVICAWPRRHDAIEIVLPDDSRVSDALTAAQLDMAEISGYAVFGERVALDTMLHDGDRLELLRPLQADPKEARRRRARDSSA